MSAVNTAKVADRRRLHFGGLDELRAEVERLAAAREVRTLGNWSAGQVLVHLAVVMEKSIDGFEYRFAPPMQLLARLLKNRFLTKPMRPGMKMPLRAYQELGPPPAEFAEGLDRLRRALNRLQTEPHGAAHPVFGAFTADEWARLHCRHAEMHLSFLVPESGAARNRVG